MSIASNNFKYNNAKYAFGQTTPTISSSDYIRNKKSDIIYNSQLNNNTFNTQPSYNDFNLFNNGYAIETGKRCRKFPFCKTDLQINLFTSLDLECVPVIASDISCPTTLDTSNFPYFAYYVSDPKGLLFGNNTCTINNYINFMKTKVRSSPYIDGDGKDITYSCIV